MKKLFLLLSAAVCTAPAFAQSQSVVFKKADNMPFLGTLPSGQVLPAKSKAANKGTAGAGEWFNWVDLMYAQGTSKSYAGSIAPDSNIKITYSNGPSNISLHGFGMSFDPTDSVFRGGDDGHTDAGYISNLDLLPQFAVFQSNPYSIDSIQFLMRYNRHDHSVVDTLIVDVMKSNRTTAGNTPGIITVFFQGGNASASPIINPYTASLDSVNASDKMEIVKIMDDAFANDTDVTTGWTNYGSNGIALPSTLNVGAGQVVVVYITMKSGKPSYPLNTDGNNANYIHIPTYDISGTGAAPGQSGNSLNSGLLVTNANTYHGINPTDPKGFRVAGHNVAIPSIGFLQDGLNINMNFKVTCPTCVPSSVPNVNSNVINANAYPNPATSEVSIKFGLKQAANTNVSIMNTVGQVIATQNAGNVNTGSVTFSTANLANGLYFYTIEANGQRTTNRFVVAH